MEQKETYKGLKCACPNPCQRQPISDQPIIAPWFGAPQFSQSLQLFELKPSSAGCIPGLTIPKTSVIWDTEASRRCDAVHTQSVVEAFSLCR